MRQMNEISISSTKKPFLIRLSNTGKAMEKISHERRNVAADDIRDTYNLRSARLPNDFFHA